MRDRIGQNTIQYREPIESYIAADAVALASDPTEVDGTTQTGFNGQPIVELDGSSITIENTSGLVVASANTLIRGLVINNFYNGIALNRATVRESWVTVLASMQQGRKRSGIIGRVYVIDSVDSLIGGSAWLIATSFPATARSVSDYWVTPSTIAYKATTWAPM